MPGKSGFDPLTPQSKRTIPMILREWRGCASPSSAEAYPAHFRAKVLPELARVPGFVGAQLSRRLLDDRIEFLVLTRWRTIAAIEGFAGPEITRAVIEPEAAAALIDFDERVQHYEVIEEA